MQQIRLFLIIAIAGVLLSVMTTEAETVPMNSVVDRSNTSTRDRDSSDQAARPTASDRTYSFTMTLPDHPGKRFSKLSFTELSQDNKTGWLPFDLSQTKAFMGTSTVGSAVDIKDVWIDETGTFWIEFNAALPPKTTLTVAFKAKPSLPGKIYRYGVAAYPNNQRPVAVFVGNGSVTVDAPSINLKR